MNPWNASRRTFAVKMFLKTNDSVVLMQRRFRQHFNAGRHGITTERKTFFCGELVFWGLLNKHYTEIEQLPKWRKRPERKIKKDANLLLLTGGISLYQDFTPANSWVRHHTGHSSSEWRDALKTTGNVALVRAVPGRTQDNNHCRRCHSEVETLAHVLGSCPFGETLHNSRHHKIRSVIATCLKSSGYTTYEEVHGIADTGSHHQLEEVNLEKRIIYEPTTPYYKTSYKLRDIEVIGLMKKSLFATCPITEIFIGKENTRTITIREHACNAARVSHIVVGRKQNIPSSESDSGPERSYHTHLPVSVTKFNNLQVSSQFCGPLAKAVYKNIKTQPVIEDD
ncbi:hypothetical protein ANN_04117 [Periplaneta americana]|uniref:DUF4817 domain-containing protein n=1 Tax=Periplaneta americana TaxID=6978 RepID=A0ABQ8TA36_PERAM|nr:hypothetical protein ANN_04117 [Periplaneta americana]